MTNYDNTLKNPNAQAFLALIRFTEGAGYSTLFGGGSIDRFEDHPRVAITRTLGGKPITSTAAGAYQFLSRTWDECKKALDLPDFSPPSQDRAAIYLIERRRALPAVLEGDWDTAIERCNREWASLPGSPYGQPTKPLNVCLAFLNNRTGGSQPADPFREVQPTNTGETNMGPFALAAIPALLQAAPALIRIFGGGGERTEKNAKAAEIAVEIAKVVTDQPTAEGAVAALQSSPELTTNYAKAVEAQWYTLAGEAGGGGIAGAREFSEKMTPVGRPYMAPALWVTLALLPLIYMALYAVLYRGGFSDDIRAMVLGAIFGGLLTGGITAFWFGTSAGSQRKTEMLSER